MFFFNSRWLVYFTFSYFKVLLPNKKTCFRLLLKKTCCKEKEKKREKEKKNSRFQIFCYIGGIKYMKNANIHFSFPKVFLLKANKGHNME